MLAYRTPEPRYTHKITVPGTSHVTFVNAERYDVDKVADELHRSRGRRAARLERPVVEEVTAS